MQECNSHTSYTNNSSGYVHLAFLYMMNTLSFHHVLMIQHCASADIAYDSLCCQGKARFHPVIVRDRDAGMGLAVWAAEDDIHSFSLLVFPPHDGQDTIINSDLESHSCLQ